MKIYTFLILVFVLVACGGNEPNATVDDALASFGAAGLDTSSCEDWTVGDSPVPNTFTAAQYCTQEDGNTYRVFSFDSASDLAAVRDYYGAFTGAFASYLYENDNLLFQASVDMPKAAAEQYQSTFESVE